MFYDIMWYDNIWSDITWYDIIWYDTIRTTRYDVMWYDMIISDVTRYHNTIYDASWHHIKRVTMRYNMTWLINIQKGRIHCDVLRCNVALHDKIYDFNVLMIDYIASHCAALHCSVVWLDVTLYHVVSYHNMPYHIELYYVLVESTEFGIKQWLQDVFWWHALSRDAWWCHVAWYYLISCYITLNFIMLHHSM